ncbi:MAG: HEAT repeat domain-containing protein, partial [Anaerolineales bacterium]
MFESPSAALRGLQAEQPVRRREAAQMLAQHPSSAACEALLAALGDPDPGAHEAIIQAIVQQDSPDRIARLVAVLREDQPTRRNAALSTLIEIGARTPDALIAALEHPSTVVRLHVAEVLGDLRNPQVPLALIAHLADTAEFPNVRHAAAQALGKIGDLAATPALIAAAEQADFWVRFAAVEALGRLGDPRAVAPLGRLLHEDPWMRAAIVEALGNIGQVEAVPDLAAALDDGNDAVRAASIEALLKIVVEPSGGDGFSSSVLDSLRPQIPAGPLRRELTAHLAPNSTHAAYLLGWLAPPEALADLIDTLGHEEETLRHAAVEAVLRYGSAAVDSLLGALRRPEGLAREDAAELLGILAGPADPPVVAALLSRLNDPSTGVRQTVVRALGALGGEAAYAGVLQALNDPDARDAALGVIAHLDDPELIGYLQRFLYGENTETRWAAAQALSLLGDETAVSVLLNATRLPDEAVRQPAAEALGRVRNARGVTVLIEALGDRDWLVRQKAVEALGNIPDGRAVTALLPLIQEPEWRVRRTLVTALARLGSDQRAVEALRGLAEDVNPWVRRLVMDLV